MHIHKDQLQKEDLSFASLNVDTSQTRMYHFPLLKELPTSFPSLEAINQTIDLILKNYNLKSLPINKIEKTMVLRETSDGAILKCKAIGCTACVVFTLRDDCYQLYKAQTQHQHQRSSGRRGRASKVNKLKNSEVEECYDELQLLNFKSKQIYELIKSRFNISKGHFAGIKFCRKRRQNIRNLLMALSKYDHFFFECKDMRQLVGYYKDEKMAESIAKQRDLILLVSKQMKQLYADYHCQYVYFSMFPDIVLETRYTKYLNYQHIGVLYGQDTTGQLTLMFGLVIMRKTLRLAYLYTLERLFSFLGKYPRVIITDYDEALAQAIKRLRLRCRVADALKLHIQMPHSFITNNFQQRLSPQYLSILSSELENTLRDSDRKSYEQRVNKLLEACQFNPAALIQKTSQALQLFLKQNSIINLPPIFFGPALTQYSITTLLRARVLDFFKSPRPLMLAVKAFFEIFKAYPVLRFLSPEQVQARINPPKQSPLNNEKLSLLQTISRQLSPRTRVKETVQALSQPALLYFYDALEQSFKGHIEQVESNKGWVYRVEEAGLTVRRVVDMVGGNRVRRWRCDCKLYFKSGLPCWHQIKTCLFQGADLTVQINPYWLTSLPRVQKVVSNIQHDVKKWSEQDSDRLTPEDGGNLNTVVNDNLFCFEQLNQQQDGEIVQQLALMEWEKDSLDEKQEVKIEETFNNLQTRPDSALDNQIPLTSVKLEEDPDMRVQSQMADLGDSILLEDPQLVQINQSSLNAEGGSAWNSYFNSPLNQCNTNEADLLSAGGSSLESLIESQDNDTNPEE